MANQFSDEFMEFEYQSPGGLPELEFSLGDHEEQKKEEETPVEEDTKGIKFELPVIGGPIGKAIDWKDFVKKEKIMEEEESPPEAHTPPAPELDIAAITARVAAKTHGDTMYIPLSSKKEEEKEPEKPQEEVDGDEVAEEFLDYLEESIIEYAKYVKNIGRLGISAVNVLYYRDDIQDIMDTLKFDESIKLKEYYAEIVQLDAILRANARALVNEMGHNSFKQYQIVNDPPPTRWWWYLNRTVSAPIEQPKFWEVWKRL